MDALDRLRQAVAKRDQAIEDVYQAIADAVSEEHPVQTVATVAGYHRNHIGRIARARGVPDARHKARRPTPEPITDDSK